MFNLAPVCAWLFLLCPCVAVAAPISALQESDAYVTQLGGGNQGSVGTPWLFPESPPVLGGAISVGLDSGRPDAFARLYFSSQSLGLPLPEFSATAWPGLPLFQQDFWTDSEGSASGLVSLPAIDGALLGLRFTAQAVVADPDAPLGVALSDGLELSFGSVSKSSFLGEVYIGTFNHDSIAFCDVDLDGISDLVSVGSGSNKVSILYGDGANGFSTKGNPTIGQNPIGIDAGDINGDGWPDLVATCSSYIGIVESSGGGQWKPWRQISSAINISDIRVRDLDQDGDLDLAYWDEDGPFFYTRMGLGNGDYEPEVSWKPSLGYRLIGQAALTDFNGDGLLDLIGLIEGWRLGIFENLGSGLFEIAPIELPMGDLFGAPGGWDVRSFTWSDADDDGFIDVVASLTKPNSSGLSSFDGALATLEISHAGQELSQSVQPMPTGSFDLIATDVNLDGLDDVVFSGGFAAGFSGLTIGLVFRTKEASAELSEPVLSDPPGGGKLVLAPSQLGLTFPLLRIGGSSNPSAGMVGVDYPNGIQQWIYLSFYQHLYSTTISSQPVLMDTNGDSRKDLVLVDGKETLLRLPNGEWSATRFNGLGEPSSGLRPTDFDGDGSLEISGIQIAFGVPNPVLKSWSSQGDGLFVESFETALPDIGVEAWVALDANGDEFQDLVAVDTKAGLPLLRVLINDGQGSFQLVQSLATGAYYSSIHVGSLTGGAADDIVLLGQNGAKIYSSSGFGTYGLAKHVLGGFWEGALGDLDGDGLLDFVGATEDLATNAWELVRVQGGASLLVSRFPVEGSPKARNASAALFDIDGDGDLDYVRSGRHVDVLVQEEFGDFGTLKSYPSPSGGETSSASVGPSRLLPLDWDLDGDLDLVISSVRSDPNPFGGAVQISSDAFVHFNLAVKSQEAAGP